MNTLEKLLEKLCPEGVEFVKLKTVVKSIKTGLNPRKNFKLNDDNSKNYYVTVKEFTSGKIKFSNKTDRINDTALEIIQNRSKLELNDVLFSGIGTIGKVAIVNIPVNNWNCSESVFLFKAIESIIIPKFLMYNLLSDFIKNQYGSQVVGSTLKGVRMGTLLELNIPLPPLAIQEKIVEILDKFTQLETELETELEARKAQYQFYRNQLLAFENKQVEWKSLGEIGKVSMCKRIMKNETTSTGDIPFYKIGTFGKIPNAFIKKEVYENYKSKYSFPKVGTILISASGTIGRTVIYDGKPAYFQDSNIVWVDNDESIVTNQFLNQFYKIIKWETDTGGVISRLYNDNIKKAKIPVPSMEEQNRIVKILDHFDDLVNDISSGLPAEIKARRQQYEYYRAKLLTFKVMENN